MRAALLHAYAVPPELGERPRPVPLAGESLVEVRAAPLAPLDLLCATGTSYFGQQPLPYVPGVQGVGVIAESDDHAPGTRVWFAKTAGMKPGDGSLAEWAVVPAADLVPITADVADDEVAAIGTSGIAAWMAVTARAQLRPGERVLILGAGGAVGQVALAVARDRGAATTVAVCRSPEATERARMAGADAVVTTDRDETRDELASRLIEAAGGNVDVVVDPVFGEPAAAALLALGPGGRLVNLGGSAGDLAEFSSAVLRGRSISVLGYTNNAISPEQRAEALTQVLRLAERGAVSVDHRVLPLADIGTAWSLASGSGPRIVVTLAAS
jgi:NADPH:quinone reductase-like Zn-dependent oxidoreductase